MSNVKVKREKIAIKTYPVGEPEKNPMFFEKRVYQGSCGKVYPVPFIDKVYDTPSMKKYDAVTLENEYVRLVLLPELGGRIYIAQDKKNGNYNFFYRNDVIKPALVGLAGPWVSGGVEFNWPQQWAGVVAAARIHASGEVIPCAEALQLWRRWQRNIPGFVLIVK